MYHHMKYNVYIYIISYNILQLYDMEPEGLAMAHALLDLFNPFQKMSTMRKFLEIIMIFTHMYHPRNQHIA